MTFCIWTPSLHRCFWDGAMAALFLFLQLRRQRGDQRWGEEILLQSWSQRNSGHLSWARPSQSSPLSQTCRPLLCLQLHGMMRVILEPLIGDVPIVGAVTMFFIKRPVCPSVLTPARPYIPTDITPSQYSHLCLRAIDFSYILSILHLSFLSLSRNWTSIGLVWLICWISLDLSESCWNYPLYGYQAHT